MKYHVDEHMPTALVTQARRRGHDITSPADAGLLGADDAEHLRWAHAQGRVVVTNDSDFIVLHDAGEPHAGLLYFPRVKPDVGTLLFWVELVALCYQPHEMVGVAVRAK